MHTRLFSGRWPAWPRSRNTRRIDGKKRNVPLLSRMSAGEQLEQRHAMAAVLSLVGPTAPVPEGQQAAFTLKLSEASKIPQRVAITTTPGSATYGVDYFAPAKQVIVFAPGQTTKTFGVSVLRDVGGDKAEGMESFTVVATPESKTLAGVSQGVKIQDTTGTSGGGGSKPQSNFQITFTYDSTVSLPVRQQLVQAANRWSSVIVGDLPDVTYNGRTIDDIEIAVKVVPAANLPAGVIAGAGYDQRRSGTGGLPYLGSMEISSAFVTAPGIQNVLAHEIGHALGFGTLWAQAADFRSLVSGIGTANPIFVGANAVREYRNLFGVTTTSVPLYEQSTLRPANYDGSYGSHWRDSVFNNASGTYFELMTSAYNVTGTLNGAAIPATISRVTVGAMQDLGYVVNYSAAEAYKYPFPYNSTNYQQATGGGASNSRNMLWSTAAGTISTGTSSAPGASVGGGSVGTPAGSTGTRMAAGSDPKLCPANVSPVVQPLNAAAPVRDQKPVVITSRRVAPVGPAPQVAQPRPSIVPPRLHGLS